MHNHGLNDFEESRPLVRSSCLKVPAAGTFGNVGRSTFRGPGLFNVEATSSSVTSFNLVFHFAGEPG